MTGKGAGQSWVDSNVGNQWQLGRDLILSASNFGLRVGGAGGPPACNHPNAATSSSNTWQPLWNAVPKANPTANLQAMAQPNGIANLQSMAQSLMNASPAVMSPPASVAGWQSGAASWQNGNKGGGWSKPTDLPSTAGWQDGNTDAGRNSSTW